MYIPNSEERGFESSIKLAPNRAQLCGEQASQHAYRPEKSCNSALAELDTFIQKNRDRGWAVGLCLTNQSAAFNVLQKDILLGKLQLLGFTPSALKLIQDYLTGRKTKCTVNGHTSSTVDLHSGVSKGSVLGPSLQSAPLSRRTSTTSTTSQWTPSPASTPTT